MPDVKFPEYIASQARERDGAETLLQMVGLLFAKGHTVAMERVNAIEVLDTLTNEIYKVDTGTTIVDLPKYQWQYEETSRREPLDAGIETQIASSPQYSWIAQSRWQQERTLLA